MHEHFKNAKVLEALAKVCYAKGQRGGYACERLNAEEPSVTLQRAKTQVPHLKRLARRALVLYIPPSVSRTFGFRYCRPRCLDWFYFTLIAHRKHAHASASAQHRCAAIAVRLGRFSPADTLVSFSRRLKSTGSTSRAFLGVINAIHCAFNWCLHAV
eukprot:6213048-Pleurochrysis_carterae.AAC.1